MHSGSSGYWRNWDSSCVGDAAGIKTKRVRKQKTDRQDAQLLRKLLLENRFPRIGVPSPEAPVPIPGNAPRSVYRQVAMARKLAVRLNWMWRNGWDYAQAVEFSSHAGQLEETHGVASCPSRFLISDICYLLSDISLFP